jgi:hypothetical protein
LASGHSPCRVGVLLAGRDPGSAPFRAAITDEERPAPLRRARPAVPDVVLERSGALHLAADPGVDGTTFHSTRDSRGVVAVVRSIHADRASRPARKSSHCWADGEHSIGRRPGVARWPPERAVERGAASSPFGDRRPAFTGRPPVPSTRDLGVAFPPFYENLAGLAHQERCRTPSLRSPWTRLRSLKSFRRV